MTLGMFGVYVLLSLIGLFIALVLLNQDTDGE